MTTFDQREKAFEAKYVHDEEIRFKVNARRNKLLGLWAAELLGFKGAEAEVYARETINSDFDRVGDEDVIEHLEKDFAARNIDMSEHRIRKELEHFAAEAKKQFLSEEN